MESFMHLSEKINRSLTMEDMVMRWLDNLLKNIANGTVKQITVNHITYEVHVDILETDS